MKSNKVNIGIDLGTNYCSVSYYDPQRDDCELVKQRDCMSSFPSYIVISINQRGGLNHLFGMEAKRRGGTYCLFDSKRLIGKTFNEYQQMGREKDNWSFNVTQDDKGYCKMVIPNPLNSSETLEFYPEEVTAMIVMELVKLVKQRIELSAEIGNVVVSVPVQFTPAQRAATIRACKVAGIENVDLINEPTAAIVEYKRCTEKYKKETMQERTKIMVINCGGGSMDVCCCQIGKGNGSETNVQVISNGGDQDLGGKHFDEVIKNLILEKIEEDFPEAISALRITPKDSARVKKAKQNRMWKMMNEAEKAKIELSRNQEVGIQLDKILGYDYYDEYITISRDEFEEKCQPLIEKFKENIHRVMRDAAFRPNDIDVVLPIGGTCCIPIVRATIDKIFPNVNKRANPLFDTISAVSKGAAYQAYQYQRSGVDDDMMVERLPYSIATSVAGGRTDFFVRKGDILPVRVEKTFHMCCDNQTQVILEMYSGESQYVTDPGMKHLGKVSIAIPPNTKTSDFAIKVIFTMTKCGRIQLEAKREKDGKTLGMMECQFDMNASDTNVMEMRNHILQFCGH